jgi:hypothetical protein
MDPTVWLDGARPPPRYTSKNLKLKNAESYISNISLGEKTFQQLKLSNSFVILSLGCSYCS